MTEVWATVMESGEGEREEANTGRGEGVEPWTMKYIMKTLLHNVANKSRDALIFQKTIATKAYAQQDM